MSVSHAPKTATSNTDEPADLREVDLCDVAALDDLFAQVPDPRWPRGIRHHVATVLTVTLLAVLAGAGNFRQAGDRAKDLPAPLLEAAGARRSPATGRLLAPCGDTLRRVVEAIDADAADLLACRWIADRARATDDADSGRAGHRAAHDDGDTRRGIAIDGKTVRNSGAGHPNANVKLFSAMLHEQAVVIAQMQVPDGTTEVTQVPALLHSVDLDSAVITADAAHCQPDTAASIRGRGGDYLPTVQHRRRARPGPPHSPSTPPPPRPAWCRPGPGPPPSPSPAGPPARPTGDVGAADIVHGITSLTDATAETISRRVRQH